MSGSGSGEASSSVHGIVVIPTDDDNLALAAIITVALQLTVYLIACSFKFDYITDFAGGTNFIVLAAVSFGLIFSLSLSFINFSLLQYNYRQIVVTILVILYGVRLAGYLLLRIIKIGKDQRNQRKSAQIPRVFHTPNVLGLHCESHSSLY